MALQSGIYSPKCPSCGGTIIYSPDSKHLTCEYCGFSEDLPSEKDQIVETKLDLQKNQYEEFDLNKTTEKLLQCSSCGAQFSIFHEQLKVNCPFCNSEKIHEEAVLQKLIKPVGIIPFYLGKREAEKKFGIWLGQGWFHPAGLKNAATLDHLQGIYIPFWTFDFQANAEWCGEAGYEYTSYQTVFVNGKMQSQPVTKIRWEYRSGVLDHFFDDVLVAASDRIDSRYREKVSGYKLSEMLNFDKRYLLGWQAEVYNQDIQTSYPLAEETVYEQVRHMCAAQLGGNVQRNLSVQTSLSKQTFKHIYLPLWLSSYHYNGKIYHVLINGQTGKVIGDKPLSWLKISLLVFSFLLIIFVIWWLKESGMVRL